MQQSRRNILHGQAWSKEVHAGLWLDKYLPYQLQKGEHVPDDRKVTPQAELVMKVARTDSPGIYDRFYDRWQQSLAESGVEMREAEVQGRLSIGLGGEAVLETAVTLHHTYGVPYIPGSALKGLAAGYAHNKLADERWRHGGEAHRILFGSMDEAGYVTFFDALYVPGTGHQRQPLWPDVITVHHPNYYQGDDPPADWDSPRPISFLSATGRYLVALQGDDAWVEKAFEILEPALQEVGIGAKTSSGYGRMAFAEPLASQAAQADGDTEVAVDHLDAADAAAVEGFKLRLNQMSDARVASEINTVYQQWKSLDSSNLAKQVVAQAILDRVEAANRTKKSAGKAWYQDLLQFVESHKS